MADGGRIVRQNYPRAALKSDLQKKDGQEGGGFKKKNLYRNAKSNTSKRHQVEKNNLAYKRRVSFLKNWEEKIRQQI